MSKDRANQPAVKITPSEEWTPSEREALSAWRLPTPPPDYTEAVLVAVAAESELPVGESFRTTRAVEEHRP